MRSDTVLIQSFERNIQELLKQYQSLKNEHQILKNHFDTLYKDYAVVKEQVSVLTEENALLKVAKTLQGSEEFKKDTQAKIDFLVLEIDQCIKALKTL